ncbi:MAG: flagellar basal body P-ring formation protein FlgA [Alphaproteobacteria bacterium]|nr:flagellar basal body P-ring formation protein FlgA [Alphaproteobacteria bacterium]
MMKSTAYLALAVATVFLCTAFLWMGTARAGTLLPDAPQFLDSGTVMKPNVVLNPNPVVDGKVIRLGDLFENVGKNSHVVVAPAPTLGRKAIYDAKWLTTIARSHNLSWKPMGAYDHAVVERASQTILFSDIKAALLAAIAKEKDGKSFEIELDNRNLKFHVPVTADVRLSVNNLVIDDRMGRFTATIITPDAKSERATGRIYEVAKIPVLRHQVKPGETIAKGDINWIKARSRDVQDNTLTRPEQIVGMTPRRWFRPGIPLRDGDLRRPVMIKKNASVRILLKVPNMTISMKGRAEEEGSLGDTVRIMNTKSQRVIDAIILNSNTVQVPADGSGNPAAQQAWAR